MDQYDEQIERLMENPKLLTSEWSAAKGVFQFVRPTKEYHQQYNDCGCLTMIRSGSVLGPCAYPPALTDRIRNDPLLPSTDELFDMMTNGRMCRKTLEYMASWQRYIDSEVRTTRVLA